MWSNERLCARQSRKLPGDAATSSSAVQPCAGFTSRMLMRRSTCSNGGGRKRKLSTTVKTAVFAPIPRVRVSAATNVKPGLRRALRNAWRRSRTRSSTGRVPCASRTASRMASTPPRRTCACRRASAGVMPARTFFSASISRWKRSSSAVSSSSRPRRRRPRSRARRSAAGLTPNLRFRLVRPPRSFCSSEHKTAIARSDCQKECMLRALRPGNVCRGDPACMMAESRRRHRRATRRAAMRRTRCDS